MHAVAPGIPPLENGDHLTLKEFERRYDAMPRLKKAGMIEGTVHGIAAAFRTARGASCSDYGLARRLLGRYPRRSLGR